MDDPFGSVVAPIYANSAFAYPSVEAWREAAEEQSGHIYTRNSNPTTDRFERKIAALEHAERATSFTTGMAAISSTLFTLLRPGRRVVSCPDLYGGSYLLLHRTLPEWGVVSTLVETDTAAVVDALSAGADVVYLETPTNPTLKVLDISAIAAAARRAGALLVIDNTLATPINQQPLTLGADLVLHSASKFIGGHGDVLGGVIAGSAELVGRIYAFREIAGTGMDPQVAAALLRSIKTLALRVEKHNASALAIASWLTSQPAVDTVHYPGLADHPSYAVAAAQMRGFGGVLSFTLRGGEPAVRSALSRLRYAYLAANLGQVETIAGPPATTSHVELTAQERARAGIPETMIRYSVGIEDVEDLRQDLENALTGL